jgi:hypothetical protein
VHQQHTDRGIGLVLVGFGDARRLAAIARALGWPGRVLSDPSRTLYARLGIGRAPWWRIYNPGTLRTYFRAFAHRRGSNRRTPRLPDEDTRQLGGDAIAVDGVVRALWRPRSPDDRPPAADVLAAAARLKQGAR